MSNTTRSSSARVAYQDKWSNDTPIHTIICTNSNKNTNKKSSFEAVIHHPRRLGSGSACERCRSRKTKCDGGQPCSFCASHGIQCIHRQTKKKRSPPSYSLTTTTTSTTSTMNTKANTKVNVNVQLPSLLHNNRQYGSQTAQFKQQKSSYFDTVIQQQQDSVKINDSSSTDSNISSIYSMHGKSIKNFKIDTYLGL